MDDASERPGDHLPWVRANDLMPGRAASTYVRIPVDIEKNRPPPGQGPEPESAETAPPVLPDIPTTAAGVMSECRSPRELIGRPNEPRLIDFGSRVSPGLAPSGVVLVLVAWLGLLLASLALVATAVLIGLLPMSARFAAALVAAMLVGLLAYPACRWALALSGRHLFRIESLEGLTSVRSTTLEAVKRRAELQALALERNDGDGFLTPLDVLAQRMVEEHAWRTFRAAAASPNGGVDALVTLTSGCSMLGDLGRIYNLHIGRIGGAVLLVRLLVDNDLVDVNDRAAEQAGEVDELPRESRFRAVLERHPIPCVAAEIEVLLAKGAVEFGLRAESGLRHYFLMRRLGARAIRLLQPLTRSDDAP